MEIEVTHRLAIGFECIQQHLQYTDAIMPMTCQRGGAMTVMGGVRVSERR